MLRQAVEIATTLEKRQKNRLLYTIYPDEGPLRRGLYPKHLQFFAAGVVHEERAAMAANRVGKSFGLGGYETALHLTGWYPQWWRGYRFTGPIYAWVAGDTSQTTRDVPQAILMGAPGAIGTGLIPAENILDTTAARGISDSLDTVRVKHSSGAPSILQFKSYDQGRKKFQGTSRHWVWLDEEPPRDVYDECRTRIMDCRGRMVCTFTPLEGLSEVATLFYQHKPVE